MSNLDINIIIAFLILILIIGLIPRKRASLSLENYFLSGRSLKWWIAGTSMVATSFASDTPLAITEFIYKDGIAGNWYWWSFAIQSVMLSFFFAGPWNKLKIMTDAEFYSIRYSGNSANILRITQAITNGILANLITLGWVYLGLSSVISVLTGWNPIISTIVCITLSLIYSTVSGLWGVVITDIFQFILAMFGSIILAYKSLEFVGGIDNLIFKLKDFDSLEKINFFPDITSSIFSAFIIYIALQWWCGSGVDSGSGILIQRICASKNPKNSFLAVMWYNIAHFAIRPWPWIVTALVAFVTFPDIDKPRLAYLHLMVKVLPSGLLGIMVVSFLSAFMSTVDTHLNWGASYLINDIYKSYLKKSKSEKHYILMARICTIILTILSGIVALKLDSITSAWKFLTLLGSGVGLIKIGRWLWWRINGWAEFSAMVISLVSSSLLMAFSNMQYHKMLIINVSITTIISFMVIFLTPKTSPEILKSFGEKIKPYGIWRDYSPKQKISFKPFLGWILGVIFVYGTLFSIGAYFFYGRSKFIIAFLITLLSAILLYLINFRRNNI